MRSRSSILVTTLALIATGCAFDDGQPWGVAEFAVEASFEPPASRLEEGLLKTAKDYRVDLDRLEVSFDVVELETSTSGRPADFDPADPPEGFSLCHGGHCHSDDGRLVPYDEIEVAAAGGDFIVTQGLANEEIGLLSGARKVGLQACSNDCELQPGALSIVRLRLNTVRAAGTARDARGELEPVEFDFVTSASIELEAIVDGEIGKGQQPRVRIDVAAELPPHLFDDVEFANPTTPPAAITRSIAEHATLNVSVEQTELPEEGR